MTATENGPYGEADATTDAPTDRAEGRDGSQPPTLTDVYMARLDEAQREATHTTIWRMVEVQVHPFPRAPFDFDAVCEALQEKLGEHGLSSSHGVLSVTFEPSGRGLRPGEADYRASKVARALHAAGIEAAEVFGRTVWTVMSTRDGA